LHGLLVHFPDPPEEITPDSAFTIGYLGAPDDTTLVTILNAVSGLAARRGYGKVAWKMPVGVGLERPLATTDFVRVWEHDLEVWLYELPVQAELNL
jgi:hypothetical protein